LEIGLTPPGTDFDPPWKKSWGRPCKNTDYSLRVSPKRANSFEKVLKNSFEITLSPKLGVVEPLN